ncbi:MAG: aminoglycoside phosphotransferase family protein [Anaerolineaceae bacterium]|nr:aminoglycoside phosphotransferase family protein [Anaerolineaceae bacterium]
MENTVRAICQKEGIHAGTIQVLSGGQVNAVYQVGNEYVVRIGAREDAFARLKRETEILQSLAGQIPVPKVFAFGQVDGLVYQIQQRLLGEKLYLLWKDLPPAAQEDIAAGLAQAMQVMHSRVVPYFGDNRAGDRQYTSWDDFIGENFKQTIAEYKALNSSVAPGFLELAQDYFEEHIHLLAEGSPTLTHSDLSLVNLLVHEGKLSAILDFEYAVYAPKDYELLVLEEFCLYPNDWAEEEHEHFCAADYASLFNLLQKYYPALFATPHLRERVNLYHLAAALSSHLAWRKDNLGSIPPERMAAKEFYMARITNFIFRHGVRMF